VPLALVIALETGLLHVLVELGDLLDWLVAEYVVPVVAECFTGVVAGSAAFAVHCLGLVLCVLPPNAPFVRSLCLLGVRLMPLEGPHVYVDEEVWCVPRFVSGSGSVVLVDPLIT